MFPSILVLFIVLNISQATTSIFKCPSSDSWISKGSKCYKWGPSPKDFSDATAYCRTLNSTIQFIEDVEENNFFRENSSSTAYWMGLTMSYNRRNSENHWQMQNNKYWNETRYYHNWRVSNNLNYNINNLGYNTMYGNRLIIICVTWDSKTGIWDATDCDHSRLFLCEKDAECISGRFGRKCSKTCHCYGKHCTSKNGVCEYGCHKRWMGKSCDKPKIKVAALYYCLNTKKDGKTLIIRANQHGIDYKRVFAVDENDNPVSSCNKSSFSRHHDKLQLTIKHKPSTNHFQPDCGVQRISDNIYKWKFHFAEFPGTNSMYDVIFEVSCDFEKADTLQRGATANSTKHKMKTKSQTKTELHVELTVQDPYTGSTLKKTKVNQNARLVVQLKSIDKDLAVRKISPHSCLAGTEDGVNAIVFLDYNGCVTENSQVIFSHGNGTTWWTEPFQTFTFTGYSHVLFTCQFDICFNDDDQLCEDRCTFLNSFSTSNKHNKTPTNVLTGVMQSQTRLDVV